MYQWIGVGWYIYQIAQPGRCTPATQLSNRIGGDLGIPSRRPFAQPDIQLYKYTALYVV